MEAAMAAAGLVARSRRNSTLSRATPIPAPNTTTVNSIASHGGLP